MELYRLRIKPLSAFGSSLLGETLFGQFCWTLRDLMGEDFLTEKLKGYLNSSPFIVVSDGFPADMIPLPLFPGTDWSNSDRDLKKLKKLAWIPKKDIKKPLKKWRNLAAEYAEQKEKDEKVINAIKGLQTHNSINRITSTTGDGGFAPFILPLNYYSDEMEFDIYVLFESSENFNKDVILKVFDTMGDNGFGRDATTGLGKFKVISFEPEKVLDTRGKTFMALSGVSLSGLNLKEPSYYKVRTHFGRHGGLLAQSKNPFKSPVITTVAGSVFTPKDPVRHGFIGSGIGNLSRSELSTVHQGYAIVVGLKISRGGADYEL